MADFVSAHLQLQESKLEDPVLGIGLASSSGSPGVLESAR